MSTFDEMIDYARDQLEIWQNLPIDEMVEQMDAHLDQEFPEVPSLWIQQAIDEVIFEKIYGAVESAHTAEVSLEHPCALSNLPHDA